MTAQPLHEGQPVIEAGAPLGTGPGAVIMVHGRGAAPENILDLVPHLKHPELSYLAPTAADRTWYPHSFMTAIAANEPWLSSALATLASLISRIEAAGVPRARIVLLGFSQGACLSSEFAVRHPARYGGVIALSGGLIGPPGTEWPANGDFNDTPVFLGCSDVDAHIPKSRVIESGDVFTRMGADTTTRIYPGMGHLVNDDEIRFARRLLDGVA